MNFLGYDVSDSDNEPSTGSSNSKVKDAEKGDLDPVMTVGGDEIHTKPVIKESIADTVIPPPCPDSVKVGQNLADAWASFVEKVEPLDDGDIDQILDAQWPLDAPRDYSNPYLAAKLFDSHGFEPGSTNIEIEFIEEERK